jgi:hypothetical protein
LGGRRRKDEKFQVKQLLNWNPMPHREITGLSVQKKWQCNEFLVK